MQTGNFPNTYATVSVTHKWNLNNMRKVRWAIN